MGKKSYYKEKLYILNAIDSSGHDANPETVKDELQFLYDTFISEYEWNIKRIGFFKALEEWLRGLPSVLTIAFYNHDILELAKEWGSLPENPTEKQEDKILDNYWRFMAMRIQELFREYKIEDY